MIKEFEKLWSIMTKQEKLDVWKKFYETYPLTWFPVIGQPVRHGIIAIIDTEDFPIQSFGVFDVDGRNERKDYCLDITAIIFFAEKNNCFPTIRQSTCYGIGYNAEIDIHKITQPHKIGSKAHMKHHNHISQIRVTVYSNNHVEVEKVECEDNIKPNKTTKNFDEVISDAMNKHYTKYEIPSDVAYAGANEESVYKTGFNGWMEWDMSGICPFQVDELVERIVEGRIVLEKASEINWCKKFLYRRARMR